MASADQVELSWQQVWDAVAPNLSTVGLEALLKALEEDDEHLLQGATTLPPPLQSVQDWPVEGACLLGYALAPDLGGFAHNAISLGTAATVGEVEAGFAALCFATDQALGVPGGIRWLLNWYDEAPREAMRQALVPAVREALAGRKEGNGTHVQQ